MFGSKINDALCNKLFPKIVFGQINFHQNFWSAGREPIVIHIFQWLCLHMERCMYCWQTRKTGPYNWWSGCSKPLWQSRVEHSAAINLNVPIFIIINYKLVCKKSCRAFFNSIFMLQLRQITSISIFGSLDFATASLVGRPQSYNHKGQARMLRRL